MQTVRNGNYLFTQGKQSTVERGQALSTKAQVKVNAIILLLLFATISPNLLNQKKRKCLS